MTTLPHALSCPSCPVFVEVSEVDADASLSGLLDHILSEHADHDRFKAYELLMQAYELTADEVAGR